MKSKFFAGCTLLIVSLAAHAQLAPSHGSSTPTTAAAPGGRPAAPADAPTMAVNPLFEIKDKPVARVNGAVLTDRDLLREMFQIFPYGQQHKGFPKALEAEIRRGALEMIIFEELVYQEAKRRGIVIPDVKVIRAETQFRKSFPTESAYKEYLKMETGGSIQAFRTKVRRSMMIEKVLGAEVRTKSQVTPVELKLEYSRRQKQYTHGELIHVQSISVMPPSSAPEVLKEAKKRADAALVQARKAKTYREFGLLAEKISDDDFHVNMGDHHELDAAKLPPPVVEAVHKMKPGDVSDLMHFGRNYAIVRLESIKPAGIRPFADVQADLRSDLQKAKEERLRSELAKKLRQTAKIEVL